MARIKPMALVESMSQKVCEHSNVYFRTNKQTGKVYSGKLCNPYEGAPSEDQVANRTRFGKVSKAVKARLAALTGEDKTKFLAAYKSQHKIGSLYGYAFKKWDKEYDVNGDFIEPELSAD